MRFCFLLSLLLSAPALADGRGVVSVGKLKLTVRDAWLLDSSSTFVRIVGVPYAAPDRKLIAGKARVEVTVWCKDEFAQSRLTMGRVDIYEENGQAYKYSWTTPAAARAVFTEALRRGNLASLSTRIDGARPETGDAQASWDLKFSKLK
ncbi:MAG: hypothetical protein U0931_34740 [Vulcanimicrobiota bacterium]